MHIYKNFVGNTLISCLIILSLCSWRCLLQTNFLENLFIYIYIIQILSFQHFSGKTQTIPITSLPSKPKFSLSIAEETSKCSLCHWESTPLLKFYFFKMRAYSISVIQNIISIPSVIHIVSKWKKLAYQSICKWLNRFLFNL